MQVTFAALQAAHDTATQLSNGSGIDYIDAYAAYLDGEQDALRTAWL